MEICMIDVIIPAHEKDSDTLELCIAGAKKNVKGVENVYVISKDKLTDSATWFPESELPFSLQDVGDKIGMHWRTCWYYADLLEGCSSVYLNGPSDYTLILDADTVFLRPVSLIEDGKALLNSSPSDGTPVYYEYIQRLIQDSPVYLHNDFTSGITHWILQEKSIVSDMMMRVQNLHGKPFWEAALDVTCEKYESLTDNNHETCAGKMASFELYFNYVLKYHPDRAKIKNQKSILAYKETLGHEGYTRRHKSRTNSGEIDILSQEERFLLELEKFSSVSEAMKHACDLCAKKGWRVMTFQGHFWKESQEYKDIHNDYISS